jgi:rubrerythrin
MRVIKIILAILLFFFAFFLLLFSIVSFTTPEMGPVAGVVFLGIGGLCVWGGVKIIKRKRETGEAALEVGSSQESNKGKKRVLEWLEKVNKKAEERKIQAEIKLQELKKRREERNFPKHREQNSMYQEWEDRHKDKTDAEIEKTLYIEYEDMNGNLSERYIKVKKVYKKGGITYIIAFCFLQVEERTFRADRILGMMDKPGSQRIKDIEAFLTEIQLSQKSKRSSSAKDLASLALEDPK